MPSKCNKKTGARSCDKDKSCLWVLKTESHKGYCRPRSRSAKSARSRSAKSARSRSASKRHSAELPSRASSYGKLIGKIRKAGHDMAKAHKVAEKKYHKTASGGYAINA